MARTAPDAPHHKMIAFVEGCFYQGLTWRAAGNEPRASEFERMARDRWARYTQGMSDATRGRLGLPSIEAVAAMAERRARTDSANGRRGPPSPTAADAPSGQDPSSP
jgi:hypothetical protein